jgi:hypothetical protein
VRLVTVAATMTNASKLATQNRGFEEGIGCSLRSWMERPSLCNAARWNAEDQREGFANKLDFIGARGEYPQLFLLPWWLSVPEALKADLISGEVRRRK